jgi:GT2 family glycosyltransferase
LIHQRGEINKTTTLWASGGSSAFDKKKWIELGGFDESFNPFYWEDIDLSYRAQKNGWMVWFEKESVVHHRHEEGVIRNQYSAENIQEIAYKNQIIFMWKNITDLSLQISHLFWLPYHLLKAFFNFDFSFIKAFVDALLCMVVIIRNRMRNQKSFVSDQEIVDKYKLEFK